MKKKTTILILLILLASVPALRALFIPELYTSHDGETHTARIANFYLALKEGQIPPRLAPTLFGNLGFPIFIFIYPLPYLLGAIFHSLGFSFSQSFEIIIGLSFVLSAISMFIFARELFGNLPGFMAALFYSWAPYRFSQIYVRGAIAESFAYIFIPLVLLSIYKLTRVNREKKFLWIGAGGLALGGLLLSHHLVSLMFLPVIITFSFIFLLKLKEKKTFILESFATFLIGFSISAYIYLPSLLERKYLHFDKLIDYYLEHFVTIPQMIHSPWSYGFSMPGAVNDDMSFQIGLTHLLVVFLTVMILIWKLLKNRRRIASQRYFWSAFTSLTIFSLSVILMLENPVTHWIWKNIPGINIIDIPWRILGISVFSASLLAAYLVKTAKSKLLLIVLLFFIFYANRNHTRINLPLERNDEYFMNYLDTATWRNEFLPKWRITNKWQNVEQDYRVSQGKIDIDPVEIKTHKIQLNIKAEEDSVLDIHRLYFPGWIYFLDQKKLILDKDFEISKSIQLETETSPHVDRSGFASIKVPTGNHKLIARFSETPIRKVGMLISAIGVLSTGILLLSGKFKLFMGNSKS